MSLNSSVWLKGVFYSSSSLHHVSSSLFRGPPSPWWFFTGSFICQDRINVVDGTNIVNLLEEWSRLNSISADKSREIYSEAAPLCWKSHVLRGHWSRPAGMQRLLSLIPTWPFSSCTFVFFPHFSHHFCPLTLKRAPFPPSIKSQGRFLLYNS